MASQPLPVIALETHPELAQSLAEVEQSGRPHAVQRDGETVALIIPVKQRRVRKRLELVDTSGLPPVPALSIAELVAMRPSWTGPTFTDEQIREALRQDRDDNWLRKSGQKRDE